MPLWLVRGTWSTHRYPGSTLGLPHGIVTLGSVIQPPHLAFLAATQHLSWDSSNRTGGVCNRSPGNPVALPTVGLSLGSLLQGGLKNCQIRVNSLPESWVLPPAGTRFQSIPFPSMGEIVSFGVHFVYSLIDTGSKCLFILSPVLSEPSHCVRASDV